MKELRTTTRCSICGSHSQIEFHHVQPTQLEGKGRGRNARYYDIIKNPQSYKALCRSCHLKEHNGESYRSRYIQQVAVAS